MDDMERNKLFVGGISRNTTDDTLVKHFSKYGAVLASVIAKDRVTGNSRGFAFITFKESSAVDLALQDSHQILTRRVEVKHAVPRSEQQNQHRRELNWNDSRNNHQVRTKKIFVGGLSANVTQLEFQTYFQQFGRITDVVVMHDNVTNRPRGFGFITFDSEDCVDDVMRRNFHQLTGKRVEVKRAVPKDGIASSGNAYNGSLASGSGPKFNSNQQGSYAYSPYDTRFGYFPSGYANFPYPYGAGMYGGGGYGGIGYRLVPIAPRSPTLFSVMGNFLPCGIVTPVYPGYFNTGPSVMNFAENGYGRMLPVDFDVKSSQVVIEEVENAVESTLSQ